MAKKTPLTEYDSPWKQILLNNSKFKIQNYLELFCLVLTIIAASILMSSSFSLSSDDNFDGSIISVVIIILN